MYFIGSRIGNDRGYGVMTCLFYVMFIATLASLPFTDLGRIVGSMADTSVIVNSLALGILITLIPYYIIAWSVKYVGQLKASVITVSESYSQPSAEPCSSMRPWTYWMCSVS